jgi:hypothetical protein
MRSFLYGETRTAEPPPARRLPGQSKSLYREDAATLLTQDESGSKRQEQVLPMEERPQNLYESSTVEFAVTSNYDLPTSGGYTKKIKRQVLLLVVTMSDKCLGWITL